MKKLLILFLIIWCGCKHKQTETTEMPRSWSAATFVPPNEKNSRQLTLSSKKVYLQRGTDGGIWVVGSMQPQPGDTFVIRANSYTYGYLGDVHGTEKDTIVIQFEGTSYFSKGWGVMNSTYVKLMPATGTETGFVVDAGTVDDNQAGPAAFSIEGKSKAIRVSGWKAFRCQYGIWAKNEHFCDDDLQSWVIDGLTFDNFEEAYLRQHGTYIGATELVNTTRCTDCNGVTKCLNPSRIGNVKIYNFYIHNVGKNGLMISDARFGRTEIFNGRVDTTGRQLDPAQGHGIASGGATNAYIHDCYINNNWLSGIGVFGGADVIVANNKIGNTGKEVYSGKESGWTESVRSVTDKNIPFKCKITIRNNTFFGSSAGNMKQIGIYNGNYDSVTVCVNGSASTFYDTQVKPTTTCSAPPEPPVVEKTVFKKGFFIIDRKRFFYTMYNDSTWSNKK